MVLAYSEALRDDPFNEDLIARLAEARVKGAHEHYLAGKAALREGRVTQASEEFEMSLALDPSRPEYRLALTEALRRKEAKEQLRDAEKLKYMGRMDDALIAFERAAILDPKLMPAYEGITAVSAERRTAKRMAKSTQPITLRFQKAKLREVFEILARTAGVNVVFDKDVRDDQVTIFLRDMPYDDALKLILSTNNLIAHKLAHDTILISPNTKQKHAQYQDLMIRTFYLSNAEAKKAVNLLRSMLESKRVFADESVNAVVVRDTPAKLHLAERVLYSIDRRQPEVILEVEVLEVDRTKSLKYGLDYQKSTSFALTPEFPTEGGGVFSIEFLTNLGKSNYLVTFPSRVTLDFFKQVSEAKILSSPKMRVVSGEKATINVGDKQPILLSTTSTSPNQVGGGVATQSTVTSTEFKDTGVKLTVEPRVHLLNELTLKVKIELTRVLDRVILQDDPEISQFRFGTRTAETTVRIRDGETIVLGGLIAEEHRKTIETTPILGDIPYIGKLFFTHYITDTITTELILTITPRIVRSMEMPGVENQAFWSGTQTQFSTDRIFAPEPKMASLTQGVGVLPADGAAASDAKTTTDSAPVAVEPRSPDRSSTEPSEAASPSEAPALPSAGPPEPPVTSAVPGAPSAGAVLPGPPPVMARGAGVLALRPSRLLTTVGQQFRVDLTADQVANFTQSVVTLTYNPKLLEFVRLSEGVLLSRSTGPSGATAAEDPEAGKLVLQVRRQGTESVVSGALAVLFFKAKGAGTSPLTLQSTQLVGAQGQSLSVSVRPASVVVR